MALPSHLFRDYRWYCAVVVYIYVLFISSTDSVEITIEDPTIQQTTARLDSLGIETFDKLKWSGYYKRYEANFVNSPYKGVYNDLQIEAPSPFGGAGRFYPLARENSFYRLVITEMGQAEPNYFGLWLSSYDSDNLLEFYKQGNPVYVLQPSDVYELTRKHQRYLRYFLNPTYWVTVPTTTPYVFLNIFFKDKTYDEVRFTAKVSKFETDNHSVGHLKGYVPPVSTTIAPKLPASKLEPGLPAPTTVKEKSYMVVIVGGIILCVLVLVGGGVFAGMYLRSQPSAASASAAKEEPQPDPNDRETVFVSDWGFA